jgi:hypothetical protein
MSQSPMEPINHKNEYQLRPITSESNDDTMIFYRVSLACRQASPHFGDSLT